MNKIDLIILILFWASTLSYLPALSHIYSNSTIREDVKACFGYWTSFVAFFGIPLTGFYLFLIRYGKGNEKGVNMNDSNDVMILSEVKK